MIESQPGDRERLQKLILFGKRKGLNFVEMSKAIGMSVTRTRSLAIRALEDDMYRKNQSIDRPWNGKSNW